MWNTLDFHELNVFFSAKEILFDRFLWKQTWGGDMVDLFGENLIVIQYEILLAEMEKGFFDSHAYGWLSQA